MNKRKKVKGLVSYKIRLSIGNEKSGEELGPRSG